MKLNKEYQTITEKYAQGNKKIQRLIENNLKAYLECDKQDKSPEEIAKTLLPASIYRIFSNLEKLNIFNIESMSSPYGKIGSKEFVAHTRKLRTKYLSIFCTNSEIDIETELLQILTDNISFEIYQEVVKNIMDEAKDDGVIYKKNFALENLNKIYKDRYMIMSPESASYLFEDSKHPFETWEKNQFFMGIQRHPTENVYVDPFFQRNKIVVGRKSGYDYWSYIPILETPVFSDLGKDFSVDKCLMTRYAKNINKINCFRKVTLHFEPCRGCELCERDKK